MEAKEWGQKIYRFLFLCLHSIAIPLQIRTGRVRVRCDLRKSGGVDASCWQFFQRHT